MSKTELTKMTTVEHAVAELGEKMYGISSVQQIERDAPNLAVLIARRRAGQLERTVAPARQASNRGMLTNADIDNRAA